MKSITILIVDDELTVRRILRDALVRVGYTVELAESGQTALERLQQPGIDLLLLDLFLGDLDGVVVMQEARKWWPSLPIIMLTAHGTLPSAIAAVQCSASDYLLKPIGIDTLRERVASVLAHSNEAQLRGEALKVMFHQMRSLLEHEGMMETAASSVSNSSVQAASQQIYEAGPLRIDTQQHVVSMDGQTIEVTPSEFMILQKLLIHQGAVVPCLQLVQVLNTAVADEEEARQLIRPHIARLRRKLEPHSPQPRYLLSIRGIGYRWADDF